MPRDKKAARDKGLALLKIIIGFGLVVYVLRSRMVDFNQLGGVLFNPLNFLMTFVMQVGMALCCAMRWYVLARAQGLSMPFKVIGSLTMIGNFFNTFLPGSVGGDLIKAWYVAGEEPERKTKAVFTVLADRVIGMAVIVFCAAVTLVLNQDWVAEHEPLRAMTYTVWAVSGLSVVVAILFFISLRYKVGLFTRAVALLENVALAHKMLEAISIYRHHPKEIFKALVLSSGNVLLLILVFYLNGKALGVDLPLSGYFFVVPIGMTISAIPLLPGGIGVGQVAFFTLFKWAGVSNPEQGSTLCTLMQIYIILFNCLGAFFYLKFKRRSAIRVTSPRTNAFEGSTFATE